MPQRHFKRKVCQGHLLERTELIRLSPCGSFHSPVVNEESHLHLNRTGGPPDGGHRQTDGRTARWRDGGGSDRQTDRVGWVDRQRFPDEQQAARWTVGVWTDGWLRGCSVLKRPLQRQSWPPSGTSSFSLYLGPGRMPGSRAFVGSFSFQREVSAAVNSLSAIRPAAPPASCQCPGGTPARVCKDLAPTWLPGGVGVQGSQDPVADLRLPAKPGQ